MLMKRLIPFFALLVAMQTGAQDLSYYLPDSVTYNPSIPKPKDIIYHEVGEWHVTHDAERNHGRRVGPGVGRCDDRPLSRTRG